MDNSFSGNPDMRRTPSEHSAYRRISRSVRHPAGSRPCPDAPQADRPGTEPVCTRCQTWTSCCFCTAEPDDMRAALRRIAELHSGCETNMCPERARLAAIPRGRRPAE